MERIYPPAGKEVLLAKEIYAIGQSCDEVAASLKKLNEAYDAKCAELQNYLVTEGKTSTGHIEGVGIFALRRQAYPSVTQLRMPQFLAFLRAEGDEGMMVETVPAKTLQAYCKTKIEEMTERLVDDPDFYSEVQEQLGIAPDKVPPPGDLAAAFYQRYGVETFSQIKLSHTKKGK